MDNDEQQELLSALISDYRQASLGDMDLAMLDYVVKLTETPAGVALDDVRRLRAVGFDDRAVHDICAITAYYAFVNRIADGLGVEMEPAEV
jgi:uncharacterized peroxidase-related enzyme